MNLPATLESPSPAHAGHHEDPVLKDPAQSRRRPSLTLSPHLLPSSGSAPQNIPVPRRHGSISNGRSPKSWGSGESLSASPSLRRQSRGSFGSLSGSVFLPPPLSVSTDGGSLYTRPTQLGESGEKELEFDGGTWLDSRIGTLFERTPDFVKGDETVEQGVKELLASQDEYIVIRREHGESGYAFFDYADLNTFLLLVLEATNGSSVHAFEDINFGQRGETVRRLRRGEPVLLESVCNISGKNPYHSVPDDSTLHCPIKYFARGVHRIAITGSAKKLRVISQTTLLRYLLSLPGDTVPAAFHSKLDSKRLGLPLHPLISLDSSASVFDAMQTMSLCGVHALGVLANGIGFRRETATLDGESSYNASPVLMANDDDSESGLVNIVRAQDCAALVVPSIGREALAMSLADMTKVVEQREEAGSQRGEERVPVKSLFGLPQPPPTQMSLHSVLSIVDVFSCLERLYSL
ncbi:hypothetical protein IAT40_006991 [Kwoniella sp. CBS 6097]